MKSIILSLALSTLFVGSLAQASSGFIGAVVESSEGIEVYINSQDYWEKQNSLVDGFSGASLKTVNSLTAKAKLCNLMQTSFEPCETGRSVSQIKKDLEKAGISVEPTFQKWAEKLASHEPSIQ